MYIKFHKSYKFPKRKTTNYFLYKKDSDSTFFIILYDYSFMEVKRISMTDRDTGAFEKEIGTLTPLKITEIDKKENKIIVEKGDFNNLSEQAIKNLIDIITSEHKDYTELVAKPKLEFLVKELYCRDQRFYYDISNLKRILTMWDSYGMRYYTFDDGNLVFFDIAYSIFFILSPIVFGED